MKLSLSFWLALAAIVLALTAVAMRLANGGPEFGDVIGPIAVSLLMFGILSNEWAKRGKR